MAIMTFIGHQTFFYYSSHLTVFDVADHEYVYFTLLYHFPYHFITNISVKKVNQLRKIRKFTLSLYSLTIFL